MRSFVKQPTFVWYAVLHHEQLMATISYSTTITSTLNNSFLHILLLVTVIIKATLRDYASDLWENQPIIADSTRNSISLSENIPTSKNCVSSTWL